MGIETYVSTRSAQNMDRARQAGADWVGNAALQKMPRRLDAAIIFPPAGNLVEPTLSMLSKGGTLVLAPVSASPIAIEKYSANLWGRTIKTLYHLTRSDAVNFIEIVRELDPHLGVLQFPFEALPEALILAKQGQLDHPNALLEIG